MAALSGGPVIHSSGAAAGPHGASNGLLVASGAVDKPVETVDSRGIAVLGRMRRGTACHNHGPVKPVDVSGAAPPNIVGISVRAGSTLTIPKSPKSEEMNFPAGQFRHFPVIFHHRRQFASLPDVALLARLVR